MTKRTHHLKIVPAPSSSHGAHQEEVSRVVRLSPLLLSLSSLQPAQTEPFRVRLDTWAAFAVVLLASSGTLYAAQWMLAHWQLR
jgi:hypothetical protein